MVRWTDRILWLVQRFALLISDKWHTTLDALTQCCYKSVQKPGFHVTKTLFSMQNVMIKLSKVAYQQSHTNIPATTDMLPSMAGFL